jgi:hypothetical protein
LPAVGATTALEAWKPAGRAAIVALGPEGESGALPEQPAVVATAAAIMTISVLE